MRFFCSSLWIIYSLFSAFLLHANENAPLIIAVEGTYPPFSYVEANGNLQGFDVEIARALCREMNRKCKIVTQNWEGLIPGLIEHKFDMLIASLSITDERSKIVAFSPPYYYEYGSFVTSKNNAEHPITSENLKAKRIGVQTGTIFALYAQKKWGKIAKIIYYNSQENANLDLIAGRLDYLIANIASIYYSLLSRPQGQAYRLVGKRIDAPEIVGKGAGIAMRKTDSHLIKDVTTALERFKQTKAYTDLLKKFHITK